MATFTKNPENYSGEDPEGFTDWKARFDVIGEANSWDDPKKLKILPSCLTQYAFQVYTRLDAGEKDTYAHLTAALEKKLVNKERKMVWMLQYRNLKRNAGESINAFVFRLRKMEVKAYPTATDDERNQHVREQFIMGQGEDIKFDLLKMEDGKTLTEIIDTAKKFEAAMEVTGGKSVNVVAQAYDRGYVGKDTQDKMGKENAEVQFQDSHSPLRRQSYEGTIPKWRGPDKRSERVGKDECFKCRKIGHFARDCPDKSDNLEGDSRQCYTCGQRGHIASKCMQGQGGRQSLGRGGRSAETCFRCNNRGHMSYQCRTDVSRTCKNCGKFGHVAAQCRSPGGSKQIVQHMKVEGGTCVGCGMNPSYVQCHCSAFYCSPVCKNEDAARHKCEKLSKNASVPVLKGGTWDEEY